VTSRKTSLWQLLKEQWLPALATFVVSAAVWVYVGNLVTAAAPWAAFIIGVVANWYRIRKGQKTEQTLSSIETNVQAAVDRISDAVGHVTGGDSVPYLWGLPDNPAGDNSPRVAVFGQHSQRDVVMQIDELPFDPPGTPVRSASARLGLIVAGHFASLPATIFDYQKGSCRRLLVTFVGLNGTTRQLIRFVESAGQWSTATRVLGHGKVLSEYVSPGYPGQPDWIEDMALINRHFGVVLGGKPYNPLA
jgi:hypothetical protein